MANPIISEATLRSLTTPESFSRGEDYYHSGAVSDIERRGDVLHAEVEGSHYEPYQVSINLDESGIVAADCSCPYDWGGYCKHIVAVLLTYIRDRTEIAERPTPDALLAGLDAETLRGLLLGLLTAHAELIPWVETQVALRAQRSQPAVSPPAQAAPPPRRSPVDTNAIRRQVRYQMRGSDDYAASGVVSGLDTILAQAVQALDANDGENALAIAATIAEEIIPGWEEFDDSDGIFGDFFPRLGAVMTEAFLTADLPAAERTPWTSRLEKWQAELDDYGVGDAFDAALAAADQGWDYAPLRRAMLGQAPSDEKSDDEESGFADALAQAWLNVLERQGRTDEFLNLARARGQITRYVTMLVKAGRVQEAIAYGLNGTLAAADALALAKALRERGEHRPALRIAERGLDAGGPQVHELAVWLREAAAALGEAPLALRAARVAFAASATLADYLAVQAAAGEGWTTLRAELLRELGGKTFTWISGPIDIYLHEGLVDDAVKLVDSQPYVDYATLGRVADAAYASHPDWVIRQCRRQAEPTMDEGKSKYYAHALGWLERGQASLPGRRPRGRVAHVLRGVDSQARPQVQPGAGAEGVVEGALGARRSVWTTRTRSDTKITKREGVKQVQVRVRLAAPSSPMAPSRYRCANASEVMLYLRSISSRSVRRTRREASSSVRCCANSLSRARSMESSP